MIGDIDIDDIDERKGREALKKEFLDLFKGIEEERVVCEKIHKKYGKLIGIKRVYARKKGSKTHYYSMDYKLDEHDNYGFWY